MKILFLGDIVGKTGCDAIKKFLPKIIKKNNIDFVIVNGENSDDSGVGITEEISEELFKSGVDVITTGNHVWDQKEISSYIAKEKRLLRPQNLSKDLPGKGFEIFVNKKGYSIGVLNLMGNIFMKKCDDAFVSATDVINENKLKPHEILSKLNDYGCNHGIGREDIVENRFIGIKSRGIYETPGGTILAKAHRDLESITLDRGEAHLKDEIMPKYAEAIYNGLWFSSERIAMQTLIDQTQKNVTGDVKIKLFKGNVIIQGRRSPFSK